MFERKRSNFFLINDGMILITSLDLVYKPVFFKTVLDSHVYLPIAQTLRNVHVILIDKWTLTRAS